MEKKELEEFKKWLFAQPEYDYVMKNFNIQIVHLGGSRASYLNNDASDYDVCAIADCEDLKAFWSVNLKNKCNNQVCHIMVSPINVLKKSFLNPVNIHPMILAAFMNKMYDDVLYITDYGKQIKSFWNSNQTHIIEYALYIYLLQDMRYIEGMFYGHDPIENKKVSKIVETYYNIKGESDIDFVRKIKFGDYLTFEENEKLKNILKELKQFVNEYDEQNIESLKMNFLF